MPLCYPACRRLNLSIAKTGWPSWGNTLVLLLVLSACSSEMEQRRSRGVFERELKKSEQGDRVAAYHVGSMYRLGIGTTRDPESALHWYEIAGPRGGWNAIGNMYNKGDGVAPDPNQAASYYRRAAETGAPPPACSLRLLPPPPPMSAHHAVVGYI